MESLDDSGRPRFEIALARSAVVEIDSRVGVCGRENESDSIHTNL
jgi:hypothetical protein